MSDVCMQLPFLKKNQVSAVEHEYLLALEISPGVIKSAVWSVINGLAQVVSIGRAQPWNNNNLSELIAATDASLSEACARVDESGKLAINRVIFGLQSDWLETDKIKPDKLDWLKQLASKLALQPVGFVVTYEAMVRFIQHNESMPPTVICLGFWPQVLEMTLVRLGKIDGSITIARSQSLADDVVEGLSRFPKVDMLPSRMLLYDSGIDLEEVKQMLLAYPWLSPSRKFAFLHFPKVEILPSDFTVRAIALSGGTEVAKSIGLLEKTEEVAASSANEILDASDFGFTTEDTNLMPPASVPVERPLPVELPPTPKFKLPAISIPKFSFPKFNLPNFSNKLILPIIAFIIIGLGVVGLLWVLPKATVTLNIAAKTLDHSFTTNMVTANLETSVAVNQSAATTGTKTIGDKATGSVTINNGRDSRTFPAGTVISSPSGIKFTFDTSVQVASASGVVGSNLVLGTAKVNITAVKVGAESNLSAGTDFQIGSLNKLDIAAKNDVDFSGGTSKQVKAVAKADVDGLRSQILESAKTQAKQQLLDKAADKVLLTDSVTAKVVTEELDHKVDEAADNVSLKLTVKAQGIAVAKPALDSAIASEISPLIPEKYRIQSSTTKSLTLKKAGKETSALSISVSANLIPQIETAEIASKITGKSLDKAREYFQSMSGVTQVEFSISPPLPIITSRLPWRTSKIEVVVRAP